MTATTTTDINHKNMLLLGKVLECESKKRKDLLIDVLCSMKHRGFVSSNFYSKTIKNRINDVGVFDPELSDFVRVQLNLMYTRRSSQECNDRVVYAVSKFVDKNKVLDVLIDRIKKSMTVRLVY